MKIWTPTLILFRDSFTKFVWKIKIYLLGIQRIDYNIPIWHARFPTFLLLTF